MTVDVRVRISLSVLQKAIHSRLKPGPANACYCQQIFERNQKSPHSRENSKLCLLIFTIQTVTKNTHSVSMPDNNTLPCLAAIVFSGTQGYEYYSSFSLLSNDSCVSRHESTSQLTRFRNSSISHPVSLQACNIIKADALASSTASW